MASCVTLAARHGGRHIGRSGRLSARLSGCAAAALHSPARCEHRILGLSNCSCSSRCLHTASALSHAAASPPLPPRGPDEKQSGGRQQGGVQHRPSDLEGFNAALRVQADEDPYKAAEMFDSMLSSGLEMSEKSYTYLLLAWANKGKMAEAERVLTQMRERGIDASVFTYTALVKGYTIAGDLESASQVFERMRAAGVPPNAVTFTTLLDAYGKRGHIEKAESLLLELESTDEGASAAPYCSLMHVYAKLRKTREVEALWERMRSKGLEPDAVAWTTLIQLRSIEGDVPRAEQHFQEMIDAGVQPHQKTIILMLSTYSKRGNVAAAEALWARLPELKIEPSAPHFNCMIQALAKAGRPEGALEYLQRLFAAGAIPTEYTYGSLMDMYAERGDAANCEDVFKQMCEKGLRPNRVVLNTMIKGRVSIGDFSGARHWLDVLRTQMPGFSPDMYSYLTFFHGYLRAEKFTEAAAILEEMRQNGFEPAPALLRKLEDASGLNPEGLGNCGSAGSTVDWVEHQSSDGGRIFRRVHADAGSSGVQNEQLEPPKSGIVQLLSERGPYYWNAATNQTSWELPMSVGSAP